MSEAHPTPPSRRPPPRYGAGRHAVTPCPPSFSSRRRSWSVTTRPPDDRWRPHEAAAGPVHQPGTWPIQQASSARCSRRALTRWSLATDVPPVGTDLRPGGSHRSTTATRRDWSATRGIPTSGVGSPGAGFRRGLACSPAPELEALERCGRLDSGPRAMVWNTWASGPVTESKGETWTLAFRLLGVCHRSWARYASRVQRLYAPRRDSLPERETIHHSSSCVPLVTCGTLNGGRDVGELDDWCDRTSDSRSAVDGPDPPARQTVSFLEYV